MNPSDYGFEVAEPMDYKDYKPVYLSDSHIVALREIKDDDKFIYDSDVLVTSIRNFPASAHKMDDTTRLELKRLEKAIDGLSDRSHRLIARNSWPVDETHPPIVGALYRALCWINIHDKENTYRQGIGKDAFSFFEINRLRAGTSATGDFTKYLEIILDAGNLDYDPHKLARDTLKRNPNGP